MVIKLVVFVVLANFHAIGEEGEAKVFSLGTEIHDQVRSVFLSRLLSERVMTLKDTHHHTTLTAMCQRVNFISASISVFSEKILWSYRDLFFPRFSLF